MDAMRIEPVFRVVVPAGEYVLGDPCYSVPEARWSELLHSCGYFDECPVGRIDDREVLAFGTAHGDGCYRGPGGAELCVDSGLIGLVPADLPGLRDEYARDLTCRVRFSRPAVCERTADGVLYFGSFCVDTSDEEGED